jgi:excisionase family DNA binding protein
MKQKEIVPLTMTVPEAGKLYFGLSRNGSYDAAARGEIPTIRVGKLLRVPRKQMEQLMDRATGKTAAA